MHHTYSGNDTNCNLIGRATILAQPTKGTAPQSLVMRFGGWVGGCTGRAPPCSTCHCGPCPSSSIALGVTECRYICRSEVTNGACTVRGASPMRIALGPIKCVLIREVSSFQGANNAQYKKLGSSVLIREVSFKRGSTVFLCFVPYTLRADGAENQLAS